MSSQARRIGTAFLPWPQSIRADVDLMLGHIVDACQFFYQCENCKTLLRPKPGDCCVFCSFGSVKCPPIQAARSCCG